MNNFSPAVATRANAGPHRWLSLLTAIAGLMMPFSAEAEIVQCLIQVDGQTYVDGPCTVRKNGEIISVGEGRDDKYSAHINAKGLSFWNSGGTRVNVPLGELAQSGPCWNNARTKICVAMSTEQAKSFAGAPTVAAWHASLSARLERGKRYPQEARARKEAGVAVLSFTVDRQGNVGNVSITKSSGSAILDKETLLLAVRLSPLPAPPDEVAGTLIPISVPIRYGSAPVDATTTAARGEKIEDTPADVYCLIRVGNKIYVDGRCARRRIEQDVISLADIEKKQFVVHILDGGRTAFWNAGNRNVSVALGTLEERGPCLGSEAVTVCVFNSADALAKFSSRYRSVFSGPAEKYLAVGFQSPSKNIHCQYQYDGNFDRIVAGIRCDLKVSLDAAPPKPANCDGDWSNKAFWISNTADAGSRVCVTDSVLDERLPVLEYGRTWKQKGIECRSEGDGISCANDKGRGFKITKASKTFF